MKISFVTPTYNRADLLVQTINSIIESVKLVPELDFEMIVVDDASNDNTEDVVSKKYSGFIENGTMIYERLPENVGVTGAKNRGAEVSSGDWIVFIDSDDLIVSSRFGDMAEVIKEKSTYDVIFFSCEDFYGGRVGEAFESAELSLSEYLKNGTYGEKLPVIRREVALSFPYDERLRGFESLSYCRILLSGLRIWVDELSCRQYRLDNPDRLSSRAGQLRRSAKFALGYSMLIRDFKQAGLRPPFSYLMKKYIYKIFSLIF